MMLMLFRLWVAWRHQFTAAGLLLALIAFLGGAPFQSVYLLVVSLQAKGDMREVLLENHAPKRNCQQRLSGAHSCLINFISCG